jgi:hypothetical protein
MQIKLHHINLCSTNVPAIDEFYRSVLDLKADLPLFNTSTIIEILLDARLIIRYLSNYGKDRRRHRARRPRARQPA